MVAGFSLNNIKSFSDDVFLMLSGNYVKKLNFRFFIILATLTSKIYHLDKLAYCFRQSGQLLGGEQLNTAFYGLFFAGCRIGYLRGCITPLLLIGAILIVVGSALVTIG